MTDHHIRSYLQIRPDNDRNTSGGSNVNDVQRAPDEGQTPEQYEIRIKGHLDPRRADWFEGLQLVAASDGTTVIQGPIPDQAALHGLLRKIRDLGLPLISVTQIETDQPKSPTGDHQ